MSPAWEGEQRDEHGRWSSGGGGASQDPIARDAHVSETLANAQNRNTAKEEEAWGRWERAGRSDSPGYRQINETLREEGSGEYGRPDVDPDQRVTVGSTIQRLDSSIARQDPIAEDVTLYRSVTGEAAEAYEGMQRGDAHVEPGFPATNTSERVAADFGSEVQAPSTSGRFGSSERGEELSSAVMRVDVPAGTRVLAPYAAAEPGAEALLPRGGTFTNVGPMHFRYGAP